jgi:glutamate synthase domain-containing protein 1
MSVTVHHRKRLSGPFASRRCGAVVLLRQRLSQRTLVYRPAACSRSRALLPRPGRSAFKSGLSLVQQRYSTNTFPYLGTGHPFRFICHNGGDQPLRGNINFMRAREGLLASPLLAGISQDRADFARPAPVTRPLDLRGIAVPTGRSLRTLSRCLDGPRGLAEPPYYEANAKRAFYEYHACLMEPWDVRFHRFHDATSSFACSPQRPAPLALHVTHDGYFILATETACSM